MNRFLKGIGFFFALIAVGVVSAVVVIGLLLRQQEVRVPDLLGRDIVSVIDLMNAQGLQLKVERREPNQTVPKDSIVSQIPEPGIGIKKGRAVKVVVSLGPSELLTPKLTGEQYRKAEVMLRQAGLPAPDISKAWSDSVERDIVFGQDPPAGTPLDRGSRVGLLVSLGRKAQVYVTPKFIGRRADEAVRTVDRMGLQHRIISGPSGTGSTATSERTVVNQKPLPGHPLAVDGMVELVVSR